MAIALKNALRPALDFIDRDRRIRARLANWVMARRYRKFHVESGEAGNSAIAAAIRSGAPFAAGRCGASELKIVKAYHEYEASGVRPAEAAGEEIFVNSGFFPVDQDNLLRFGDFYEDCARQLDIFAVWRQSGEIDLLERMGDRPPARICGLMALEPYFFEHGWTDALAGKRVLVVSPFTETIKHQHKKLREIWPHLNMPDFELLTLRSPHSQALVDTGFPSWWSLQDDLRARMGEIDFDIAIVGAGAGTLPLAVHAKSLGKQGIALGGATQVLFGVRGRRWEHFTFFRKAINEAWTRPQGDEVPPQSQKVESGAYW